MKSYIWTCANELETSRLAEELGELLQAGDVLALEGDLGAGKTTFTKGIAKALGVTRTVNSPTFTIMKQYQGKFPLYHFDVYRLENEDEDFGFDEYFEGEGVTVIEWAHLIGSQLPAQRLSISITYLDIEERRFTLTPTGERYEQICVTLSKNVQGAITHDDISN